MVLSYRAIILIFFVLCVARRLPISAESFKQNSRIDKQHALL